MKSLVLALYPEGSTDIRFLPPLIQRTAENIIANLGNQIVDVLEPIIVPKQEGRRDECIYRASLYTFGYHALIVHSDADDRTPERAKRERIQPGFNLVNQRDEKLCKNLIPLIPVYMVESWMLADHQTLCEVVGTSISAQDLQLPTRPALVESDANPKETLHNMINMVNSDRSGRRKQITLNTRYELLARRIDLKKLSYVPSYIQFADDLTATLRELHFIPSEVRDH